MQLTNLEALLVKDIFSLAARHGCEDDYAVAAAAQISLTKNVSEDEARALLYEVLETLPADMPWVSSSHYAFLKDDTVWREQHGRRFEKQMATLEKEGATPEDGAFISASVQW